MGLFVPAMGVKKERLAGSFACGRKARSLSRLA
jgi:hypothetical protein